MNRNVNQYEHQPAGTSLVLFFFNIFNVLKTPGKKNKKQINLCYIKPISYNINNYRLPEKRCGAVLQS